MGWPQAAYNARWKQVRLRRQFGVVIVLLTFSE